MENVFKDICKGKVVVVGIGNLLRGDDGLGPALVAELKKEKTKLVCFDVGVSPENYIGKIAKERPDTVLIIDAVHLGRKVGNYEVMKPSEILEIGFTTHDISPKMFLEHLSNETDAEICMVGIQPQNISIGDEISQEVTETITKIKYLLLEVAHARNTLN